MDTTIPKPSGRSYGELAAKMREKPTFAVAEDTIKKDYPLKLPSRRFIQLWNTPEISQFRGYQEDLDAAEENREQHTRERIEIRQSARESGGSVPEMEMVHEMLSHQRQQQGAMAEHMAGLNEINRQQMEGMRAEQRAELQRLAAAQMEAANRAAMAEQALMGLRDVTLEHRNMIGRLAEQQGVVHQNFDQRHTSTTIVHQNVDQEVHNRAMDMLRTHADQFGQYMHQQNLNAEQMQRLLYAHLMRNQNPAVIHIQPPAGSGEIVQFAGGSGGPPPGPPGSGAVKIKKQAKAKKEPRPINITYGTGPPPPPAAPPAPAPEPAPAIPAAVPHFDIGTPPPPPRGRARSRTPAAPRARAASRPPPGPTPWQGGFENPPAMPAAPAAARRGRPPKRASEEEAVEAPVAVRARAKSRARSASVAETVFYPEQEPQRPISAPAPKRRGRPPKNPVLPTQEDAMQHEEEEVAEVRRRGKEMALQARVVANATKFSRPKAKARPRTAKGLPVPEAAPPDKKPRVRKVAIQSKPMDSVLEKRPRGRPKGSVGKKKRDALLEEELRRLSTVQV